MKKLLSLLLLILISGCLGAGDQHAEQRHSAEQRSLLILHTNDFHGHISEEANYAGAARISALLKSYRNARKDVLIVDAGDAVSGTPVSTLFKGTPIFEVMSQMGYDVGTLGNHEFDYGWQQINQFIAAANFPLLSANAFGPAGQPLGDGPWRIIEINGIRIGIIGLITETTPYIIIPKGNEGLRFDPPLLVTQQLVDQLAGQTDIIVLLSHLGHEEDLDLARKVQGVDIIIGGHSHTLVNPPVKIDRKDGSTWVAQADAYGTHVGVIELMIDVDENRITAFDGRLIAANDMIEVDPVVEALISTWEARVTEQVDHEIATAVRTYSREEVKRWMEGVMRETTGADIAYYNKGGVRDQIYQGPVSIRHLWNIEPFSNTLVIMTLKGKHINEMLKDDTSRRTKLKDDQTYTFATNSFIGQHTKKRLKDAVEIRDTGVLVRDVLIDAVRKTGLPSKPAP